MTKKARNYINPKVISIIPYTMWRQLGYRRQRQVLEFIEGYINIRGAKQIELVLALMHMFDIDEDTANYAIDLYNKIKPKTVRKNPEGKYRGIVGETYSAATFWNRLDKFLQRMIELSVKGYRRQGLSEAQVADKLMKDFGLTDYVAVGIVTDIIPLEAMRSNPIKRNSAGTVKIYDTIIAIEAKKGNKSESLWPNENFRHDFKGKSKAAIYGLEDGSILIKSQNGKRLWDTFDYNEEDI